MYRVTELLDRRRRLIEEARGILDKSEVEKRSLSTEETTKYDTILADAEKLKADADRVQRQEMAERSLSEPAPTVVPPVPVRGSLPLAKGAKVEKSQEQLELEQRAEAAFFRTGVQSLSADEQRALEATTDASGGNLVATEQFMTRLIQAVDNAVFVRNLATVIPVTTSDTLGIPTLTADPADADWTSEVGTISADSTMALGKRQLVPTQLTKLAKVSLKLLRVSAIDPAALVAQRLAYKFQTPLENAYLNGSGSSQPLGMFTASANGIPTSRDVSTDNTSSAVTPEGLLNALYSVKAQYRRSPGFAFIGHRDLIKMISKFRDGSGGAGTGQFMWEPSVKAGEPDRFKGVAVYESEYAPNTFTTGLYVGLFGDIQYYWIADLQTFNIQRLNELFALNSQVGFIGRLESDGAPVLAEAFARVKLG